MRAGASPVYQPNILIFTGGNLGLGGILSEYICHHTFTNVELTTNNAKYNSSLKFLK